MKSSSESWQSISIEDGIERAYQRLLELDQDENNRLAAIAARHQASAGPSYQQNNPPHHPRPGAPNSQPSNNGRPQNRQPENRYASTRGVTTTPEANMEIDEEDVLEIDLEEEVMNFPIPKNVKKVRGFLGVTSWLRRFIPKLAEKSEPLYQLTSKNQKFIWLSIH
jgi:hypothetical protein